MIRLIQRRLIIPRGDTGTFSIPALAGKQVGDAAIFTIFNPLTHRKIFEKGMELSGEVLNMSLTHGDTVNLPVGSYVWDVKFYTNPLWADEKLVGGEEVDSYYAAFSLPQCEIRETGDNLLMDDEVPAAALTPREINLITAALAQSNANVEHYPKIIDDEWYVWDEVSGEFVSTGVLADYLKVTDVEAISIEELNQIIGGE